MTIGRSIALRSAIGAGTLLVGAAALATGHQATVAGPVAANSAIACASLATTVIPDTTIVSARVQPAGEPVEGTEDTNGFVAPVPISGLPAFCRVIGRIQPEAGSDIAFETWLPLIGWDNRFHALGNGGNAGSINYAGMAGALRAGKATASTNTGHRDKSFLSGWAKGHPVRIADYGWRGIHLMTVAAKALTSRFYGRAPQRSYFMSCSNGGRQGLMEASRFPADYDGILAGDPSASKTETTLSMIWTVQAQTPPGAAIRPEQATLIRDEVLRQCDALDGAADGLVSYPPACRFDSAALACGRSSSTQCLTRPQMEALRKIHAGPPARTGQPSGHGFPPTGLEAGFPMPGNGWDAWILAREGPLSHRNFASGALRDFPASVYATVESFDWRSDPARLRADNVQIDVEPDLRAFFARDGKLIMFHGWGDAGNPPGQSIRFFESLLTRSDGQAPNARLFMVPGLLHCTGAAEFGQYGDRVIPSPSDSPEHHIGAALQAWVEAGRAPDSVVASLSAANGKLGDRQLLLCPYPAHALLRPGADPGAAASYSCRAP